MLFCIFTCDFNSNVLITLVSTSAAHIAVCNRVVNENVINVVVDSLLGTKNLAKQIKNPKSASKLLSDDI